MAFPVSDDFIAAAEEALGRRFPTAMRTRLARSNGGEIAAADDDWILHPVRDDTDRKRLSRSANDIVRETGVAREWAKFPEGGIAIASNGGGDLLVLLRNSDDLFHWDHETGEVKRVDVDWA
jgi:hypothetical protein